MDATAKDLVRQIVVISATVYMLIAAAVGSGLLGGTPVQDLQDGALAADGSFLAPAAPAFSIWSVIYVLLIAYAVWQALPAQRAPRASARDRLVGRRDRGAQRDLARARAVHDARAHRGRIVAAARRALRRPSCRPIRFPAEGVLDSLLIDGATGLHLGWVSLATVANIAAWLTAIGPDSWADSADVWGVVVLVVVGVIGVGDRVGERMAGRARPRDRRGGCRGSPSGVCRTSRRASVDRRHGDHRGRRGGRRARARRTLVHRAIEVRNAEA